jgi:hypothetical protein
LPATLFGYIWKASKRHQVGLCLLSVTVFLLSAVPLELQRRIGALTANAVAAEDRAMAEGVEISMILSESEPIGGFVGMSISEPLLQGGVLLSVFGYLAWLEPWMALLGVAVFSPQLVFVPLMQQAINRRAGARIRTLREVSGKIVGAEGGDAATMTTQNGRIEVGTVVAFVSGLAKVNDPWGDVVNWFREMTVVDMRYRLVADAMRGLTKKEAPA